MNSVNLVYHKKVLYFCLMTMLYASIFVSIATFEDMQPCEVYRATIGSCKPGYLCTVINNAPSCGYILNSMICNSFDFVVVVVL